MRYTLIVAAAAGFIWGGLWKLAHFFDFTKHDGQLLLLLLVSACFSWLSHSVTVGRGTWIRPLLLVAAAWGLLMLFPVYLPGFRVFTEPDWTTLITDLCLLTQWAFFIDESHRLTGNRSSIFSIR